ncbi:hypothetical protein HDU98_002448, partial [Podochytrium sp. JEL0797]
MARRGRFTFDSHRAGAFGPNRAIDSRGLLYRTPLHDASGAKQEEHQEAPVRAKQIESEQVPLLADNHPAFHLQAARCINKPYKDLHVPNITKYSEFCRFNAFRLFRTPSLHYGPWFRPSPVDAPPGNPRLAGLDTIACRLANPTDARFEIHVQNRHVVHTTHRDEIYILQNTAKVLVSIIDAELAVLRFDSHGVPIREVEENRGEEVDEFEEEQLEEKGFVECQATMKKPFSPLPPFYHPPPPVSAETSFRQLCDDCKTSLFNTYHLCAVCAKEICSDCFATLPPTLQEAQDRLPKSKTMVLETCGPKQNRKAHSRRQFVVLSKMGVRELVEMRKVAVMVLEMEGGGSDLGDGGDGVEGNGEEARGNCSPQPVHLKPTTTTTSTSSTRHSPDSKNYLRLTTAPPSPSLFEHEWRAGRTVVYSGGTERITAGWGPAYFRRHHGTEMAPVVDCVTKESLEMSVDEFFEYFEEVGKKRKRILKLPDWPSHLNFSTKFPVHFADFKANAPFEAYSGFMGARNLAARLPQHYVPPDLGPKMYNAFGSSDAGKNGFGTTPIHLDMADAVNIMMHASSLTSPPPPTAAVWDIYPRTDTPKIRAYLSRYAERVGIKKVEDPVHDQFFYLNEEMRRELRGEGVVGWRVWQGVGDAVFVPAG